jgi:streptogramin lyase
MKRRELFCALGAFGAITFASVHLVDASVNVLTPIELPANFQYPNGITHASDGTLYIGSITSGRILRIDPTGEISTLFSGNADVFAAIDVSDRRITVRLSGDKQDRNEAQRLCTSAPSELLAGISHRLDSLSFHGCCLHPIFRFAEEVST